MAGTRRGWMKSLSPPHRHEVAAMVHAWENRRAARISVGQPPSSPEENSDEEDATMEEWSDEEQPPAPVVGFTMQQTDAHYNRVLVAAEQEEQAPPPVSAFRMLQEEQRYNLQLLE